MAGAPNIKLRIQISGKTSNEPARLRRRWSNFRFSSPINIFVSLFFAVGSLHHTQRLRGRNTSAMKLSVQFFLSLGLLSSVQPFPHGADESNDALGFERVDAPPAGGMRVRRRLKGSKSKKGSKGDHKSGTSLNFFRISRSLFDALLTTPSRRIARIQRTFEVAPCATSEASFLQVSSKADSSSSLSKTSSSTSFVEVASKASSTSSFLETSSASSLVEVTSEASADPGSASKRQRQRKGVLASSSPTRQRKR
jgi:hypothetical protein